MNFLFLLVALMSVCSLSICNQYIDIGRTTAKMYQHMGYISTEPYFGNFPFRTKFVCAAHCARNYMNCSIAVFEKSTTGFCLLYNEEFSSNNLIFSQNATVIQFKHTTNSTGKNNVLSSDGISKHDLLPHIDQRECLVNEAI